MDLNLAIMRSGVPETRAAPAVEFVRACLHLDPDERPSALDLDNVPWFYDAYYTCLS